MKAPQAPSPLQVPEFRRLTAISITVAIGFGMVIPVLPDFARSFGVGIAAIGLIQLVFGLTRFSFGVVGGLAVDRFGERTTTLTGILIVALSSYAAGLSQSFLQLVLARGFGGAGSALFIAGLMNRILRIIEPAAMGRATGIFRSSFLIGIGLGPLFGGLVGDELGLSAPFHIYATGLLAAAAIAWFAMAGEPARGRAEKRTPLDALRAAAPLFSDIRYTAALAATFVGWWTISGPAQILGVVFAKDQLGFSGAQVGASLTLLSLGELVVLPLAGRAADTYGRRAVLVPALALSAVSVAAVGRIETTPLLFYVLMALIGASVAAGSTAAGGLLADSVPRSGSGAAVGMNQMAGDLGYLTAPSALGYVAQGSFQLAYLLAAAPAALVLVVALRLPGRRAKGTAAPVQTAEPEPAEPIG
ncbi:MAG: MFS transporter [Actinomycetota bacterium]|nr:MFS transporter [Actinomycetota bacterium]